MAGIGFELVKLLQKNSYAGLLRAYSLTISIASGPGLLILFSLGIVCFFSFFSIPSEVVAHQFMAVVIYLLAGSMIISSLLQYTFTRFVADADFIHQYEKITPNYIGVLLIQLLLSISFILPVVFYFFRDYNILLQILIVSTFCILSQIWISTVLLTEAKSYRRIVWGFILGYITMIILHFILEEKQNTLVFLLFEFFIAQCILFVSLLYSIITLYPANKLIQFDFLKKKNFYFTLVFANFFYNLGFWVDKFLFWFNHNTGNNILPSINLSTLYDLPIFIASLTMIPGIAFFMLLLESRFALVYPKVMDTIFNQKTLSEIEAVISELITLGREIIISLIKVQAAVIIIILLSSYYIFSIFNILSIYSNLLFILVVSGGLQVILWALLSLLYYMTRYNHVLYITLTFFISNFVLTSISLRSSPIYYGYGVSFSLLISILLALFLLEKDFKNIEYNTFMMVD